MRGGRRIVSAWGRRGVVLVLVGETACAPQATPFVAEKKAVTPDITPPPPPAWRVGDQWSYNDGYRIEVTDVLGTDKARFRLIDDREQWMVRRAFFVESSRVDGVVRTTVFRSADPMALFTVPVGTPVSYLRETMRGMETLRHRVAWTVEGREAITVPAGTFDCWVVAVRVTSMQSPYQSYERWWYSPQARSYVRLEYKAGERPETSRVLVSYALARDEGGKADKSLENNTENRNDDHDNATEAPGQLGKAPAGADESVGRESVGE